MKICKKIKFPKNPYEIYYKTKKELNVFLSNWFHTYEKYKNQFFKDVLWTVKRVSTKSRAFLYGQLYNPVFVNIMPELSSDYKTISGIYSMKAQIMSIDDSSYGIWWRRYKNYKELREIREYVCGYIDNNKILDGDNFLSFCEKYGGIDKDYN